MDRIRFCPSLNPQLLTLNPFHTFIGRWGGGIDTRIPGGSYAHAGRSGQFAAPETNINLTQVVNPPDYPREVLFGRSSRNGDCAICLLETKPALPILPLDMNFRFNIGKATEAGCLFLERAGGRMNIMKLVKLMYLLDRLSLDRRGVPVAGGDYLSMRNGPVTSELLDLINAGRLFGEPDQRWEQCVTDRRDHDIKLGMCPHATTSLMWRRHCWMKSGASTAPKISGNSWIGATPTARSGHR